MGLLVARSKTNPPKVGRKYWAHIGAYSDLVKVVKQVGNKFQVRRIISDPAFGDDIYKEGRVLPKLRAAHELYNIHTP